MRILFLVLFSFLTASGISQNISEYYNEYGVKGSFMMYDMKNDKFFYYDSTRCFIRFTPASTFKIPNSIIGLETGVIADENFVIPWDSVKRWVDAWNHDMDLKTAIKVSCVPYYQELARRVGEEKMREFVTKFNYGNMDMSSGIDKFWLSGSMEISQSEQVAFLRKLYNEELPVSKRSMDITKNIMLLEDTPGYKLRAKTGWGNVDSNNIGWFVGWVEKDNNVYFFANNIETKDARDNFPAARKEISEKIMKSLGVY